MASTIDDSKLMQGLLKKSRPSEYDVQVHVSVRFHGSVFSKMKQNRQSRGDLKPIARAQSVSLDS